MARVLGFGVAAVMVGGVLLSAGAAPASAAGKVPYSGTSKADKIDFRKSYKAYDIKGLGGNDQIYTNGYDDVVDGGKGADTINPGYGNDVVRGGPDKDYFRYEVHSNDGDREASGFDTICDFSKGDKLDVYFTGEYVGFDENDEVVISFTLDGGNYAWFDTNKDGAVDAKDAVANVKTVAACGGSKPSLVLDVYKAFTGQSVSQEGERATLTLYGVAGLKKGDFVKNYHRDKDY